MRKLFLLSEGLKQKLYIDTCFTQKLMVLDKSKWSHSLLDLSDCGQTGNKTCYHTSSNKHQASNKYCPLLSTAPLGIHIKISASPLKSTALLNVAFNRIVTIFY